MRMEVELMEDLATAKVRFGDWVARIETARLEMFIYPGRPH